MHELICKALGAIAITGLLVSCASLIWGRLVRRSYDQGAKFRVIVLLVVFVSLLVLDCLVYFGWNETLAEWSLLKLFLGTGTCLILLLLNFWRWQEDRVAKGQHRSFLFVLAMVTIEVFPNICKSRWYVILAPFFASVVTAAYFHKPIHLAVGVAIALLFGVGRSLAYVLLW